MSTSRQVTFSTTSQMVVVTNLSVGPYKHNLWYTKEEKEVFMLDAAVQINEVRLCISKNHSPSSSSIVGIEKYLTSEVTEEYIARRDKLKKKILNEAQWQQNMGCTNYAESTERLRRISAENSEWARERAAEAARFLDKDQEKERTRQHRIEQTNGSNQHRKQFDVGIASSHSQLRLRSSLRGKKRSRITTDASLPCCVAHNPKL